MPKRNLPIPKPTPAIVCPACHELVWPAGIPGPALTSDVVCELCGLIFSVEAAVNARAGSTEPDPPIRWQHV